MNVVLALVALIGAALLVAALVLFRKPLRPDENTPLRSDDSRYAPSLRRARRAEAKKRRTALLAWRAQRRFSDAPPERYVIDDRVLLLGLDTLYRDAMKPHESGELLECARAITAALGVPPADGPVEGYYTETPELTEYFQRMRALQATDESERPRVEGRWEFERVIEVTSSPLYGKAIWADGLLPGGRDPLSEALLDITMSKWTVAALTERACQVAVETDSFSLVGLAARTRDPVLLTATRESVVLYAESVTGDAPAMKYPRRREFVWQVDPDLARLAARFVATFNDLCDEALPEPVAKNAEDFWDAHDDGAIVGRCVRIGTTLPPDVQHYHWAIYREPDLSLAVQEFWHAELWTTSRYRALLRRDGKPRIA